MIILKRLCALLACMTIAFSAYSQQTTNTLARPEGLWHDVKNYFSSTIFAPLFTLTYPESQRENWSTGLVAEPLATITNAGLFAAAYIHRESAPLSSAALAAAGIASALSHAIPYQILNTIDKIAAAGSVLAVAYDAKLYNLEVLKKTLKNPFLAALLATTGLVYTADVYIPRSNIQRKKEHAYIHAVWHILAALLAHTTLKINTQK